MAVINIKGRSRTTLRLEGKVNEGLITLAYRTTKGDLGNRCDIFMWHDYYKHDDETIISLYPCKVEFEEAYSLDLHKLKFGEEKRKFVGACNIWYNEELLPIKSEDVVDALWMPIKKRCRKYLTLIPFADKATGKKRRWQLLCDSRISNEESQEFMILAATQMMDNIATNIDDADASKMPPVVGYLDEVSAKLAENLIHLASEF